MLRFVLAFDRARSFRSRLLKRNRATAIPCAGVLLIAAALSSQFAWADDPAAPAPAPTPPPVAAAPPAKDAAPPASDAAPPDAAARAKAAIASAAANKGEPTPEFFPEVPPSEQRLLDALQQPANFDFEEKPLHDVADVVRRTYGIEVQLDLKALTDALVEPDTPVTKRLKGIKLSSALNLTLSPMELIATVRDETLLITTRDQADSTMITRVYPIGDLIDVVEDFTILRDAICHGIKPEGWSHVGGGGELKMVPASQSMVIAQTREQHEQIVTLLRSLRQARSIADPNRRLIYVPPPAPPKPEPAAAQMQGMGHMGMGGFSGMAPPGFPAAETPANP